MWPARAVWTCIGWTLLFSMVGGVAFALAALVTDDTTLRVAAMVPFQYLGMFIAVRRVSRRHGTGDVVRDVSWRLGWSDVWPGIGLALVALVVTSIGANIARVLLELEPGDQDQFGSLTETSSGRVLVLALGVVLAPIFEEALFRGVVLHALLRRGAWFAVVTSSLLFASTHLDPGLHWRQNALLLCSTFVTGAVLAVGALRLDRLGPNMLAHSLFNVVAILALLSTT